MLTAASRAQPSLCLYVQQWQPGWVRGPPFLENLGAVGMNTWDENLAVK